MSQQSDPKKAETADENWKPRSGSKRSRVRPFVIEWRYAGDSSWMKKRYGHWQKWGAYETERQRDHALMQKQKSDARINFEYRAAGT